MNKLLISLLSLTGIAGISTGGYFLLRSNEENNEQKETGTSNGGDTPVKEPSATPVSNGQSNSTDSESPQAGGTSQNGGEPSTQ